MKRKNNLICRIVAIVLVMLLAMAILPSCGGQLNAYRLLARAIEKTQALDSYELEMDGAMNVKTEGVSVEVPFSARIRMADANSSSPRVLSDLSTTALGETIEMSLYSENNVYYMDVMGQKVKMSDKDTVEQMGMLGGMDAKTVLVLLPEAMFAGASVLSEPNGNRSITVKMDGDTFSKYYADLVKSGASESVGEDFDINDVQLAEATVTYRINPEEYIVGIKISFGMLMNVDAGTLTGDVSYEMEIAANYVNPGQPVEVTAPEGLERYLDLSLLG